jgi:hypothetical protein
MTLESKAQTIEGSFITEKKNVYQTSQTRDLSLYNMDQDLSMACLFYQAIYPCFFNHNKNKFKRFKHIFKLNYSYRQQQNAHHADKKLLLPLVKFGKTSLAQWIAKAGIFILLFILPIGLISAAWQYWHYQLHSISFYLTPLLCGSFLTVTGLNAYYYNIPFGRDLFFILNRKTGKIIDERLKLNFKFSDLHPFIGTTRTWYGHHKFLLLLYHPNSQSTLTLFQGDELNVILYWNFIARYMDLSNPMPDIPEFAKFQKTATGSDNAACMDDLIFNTDLNMGLSEIKSIHHQQLSTAKKWLYMRNSSLQSFFKKQSTASSMSDIGFRLSDQL